MLSGTCRPQTGVCDTLTLKVELILTVSGLLLAWLAPQSFSSARRVLRALARGVARRCSLSILLLFGLSFICLTAVGIRAGLPVPAVHDEFVYLMMGDTFAQGRLTNAAPPLAEHEFYEEPHVILRPTHQGKYPPLQGMFLALGQTVTSYPVVGVWLSYALATAAIGWMLRAWMPARWSLLGALLFALHPELTLGWGQSYWGGAVACLGGAILFGSLPRFSTTGNTRYAVLIGFALFVIANARPYEGLVASIPAGIWLAAIFMARARSLGVTSVLAPALALLLTLTCGGALMATYNAAVTGDPMRLPYQEWLAQYTNLDTFAEVTVDGRALGEGSEKTDRKIISLRYYKAIKFHYMFLRIALTLPLLALPWTLRSRRFRFALLVVGLVWCCVLLNPTSGWPHYHAPSTALLFALIVQGLRHFAASGPRWRCIGAACVSLVLVTGIASQSAWTRQPAPPHHVWAYTRLQVEDRLIRNGSDDVVFVRYAPDHEPAYGWVHNSGRLDTQDVLWVNAGTSDDNEAFQALHPRRVPWILDVEATGCTLTPYTGGTDLRERFPYRLPSLSDRLTLQRTVASPPWRPSKSAASIVDSGSNAVEVIANP